MRSILIFVSLLAVIECTPKCGPVCLIHCDFGNVPDANGCPTCECNVHPCSLAFCPEDSVCVLEEVQCVKQPCYPVATCKKRSEVEGVCRKPKKVGPCTASVPRFYYNAAADTCQVFNWGGCKSNGNNFASEAICKSFCLREEAIPTPAPECPPVCDKFCLFGKALDGNGCTTCTCNPDPCTTVKCGAGEQCVLQSVQCVTQPCPPVPVCKPITEVKDVCDDPLKVGPCRGVFPRYYFNHKTQQCERFSWGGCHLNKNNFNDLATCKSYCPPDTVQPPCPPVCNIFCEFGNVLDRNGCPTCRCKRDPCQTVKCGAGKQCVLQSVQCVTQPCPPVPVCKPMAEVKDACDDPLKVGPCRGVFPRYYFNHKTQQCERFSWGGCRPNKNNFNDLATCKSYCPPDTVQPPCPPVCDIFCEFGNVLDRNGCPTCRCKRDPCQTVKCGAGKQCVLQPVQCVTQPCPPVPVCKPITEVKDACDDPLKVGPCRGALPRYYFNHKTQQCEHFSWGGCHPNKNNFNDLATCKSYCPPDTVKPPCRPVCRRFCKFGLVLDKNGCQKCECKQNPCKRKRCRGRKQCVLQQVTCVRAPCPPVAVCKNISDTKGACYEPKKEGPCEALIPRFYYNSRTRRCQGFKWGGCDANGNNFPTLSACRSRCERAPLH